MNDPQHEMESVEKRTRRYWFDDGITELVAGLAFLLVALYLLAERAFRSSALGRVFDLALPILVVVLAFATLRVVRAAKDRYVHPRTGFVSFPRKHQTRLAKIANALAAFVVAALFVFLVSHTPSLRTWIPAFTGALFAISFLVAGRRVDLVRLPIEGLACAAAGVLLSVMALDRDVATALLFGWLGAVLVVGGLVGFIGYLRHTPPPEQA